MPHVSTTFFSTLLVATEASQSVPMARREIVDLVDRCCRVRGIDAGTAHRCAENVAHGEVHHGGAVHAFLDALTQGAESLDRFAHAPSAVELAEATDDVQVVFDPAVALASLSACLSEAATRGFVAASLSDVSDASALVTAINFARTALSDESRNAASQRELSAGMHGVAVSSAALRQLELHSASFLVAESAVDEAVDESE